LLAFAAPLRTHSSTERGVLETMREFSDDEGVLERRRES